MSDENVMRTPKRLVGQHITDERRTVPRFRGTSTTRGPEKDDRHVKVGHGGRREKGEVRSSCKLREHVIIPLTVGFVFELLEVLHIHPHSFSPFFMPVSIMPPNGSYRYAEHIRADYANVQMPHVFVHPPEEDETPAWCCFNAENPALSQVIERPETPEISVLAFPSEDPDFRRQSVIMARTNPDAQSVVDALVDDDLDEESDVESEIFNEEDAEHPHSIQENNRHTSSRDAANDSDVIEVVKVRRKSHLQDEAEQAQEAQPAPQHTKTLKSRASRAFQSLKGSLRSKTRAQDVFPSSSSTSSSQTGRSSGEQRQETQFRARTPTVSRRGSRILSQLFNGPPLKNSVSIPSFDESPASPTQASLPPSDYSGNQNQPSLSSRDSLYDPLAQDQARLRAASPAPSTASKFGTGRFSKLNLQKLFSFSSSSQREPITSPIEYEELDRAATPTLRSVTSTPASSWTSSTSGPQTPTSTDGPIPAQLVPNEDTKTAPAEVPVFDSVESMFDTDNGLNLGLGIGLDLDSPNSEFGSRQETPTPRKSTSSSLWESITPRRLSKARSSTSSPPVEEDEDEDMSLEMKLDSLHFESISFDADQFKF